MDFMRISIWPLKATMVEKAFLFGFTCLLPPLPSE